MSHLFFLPKYPFQGFVVSVPLVAMMILYAEYSIPWEPGVVTTIFSKATCGNLVRGAPFVQELERVTCTNQLLVFSQNHIYICRQIYHLYTQRTCMMASIVIFQYINAMLHWKIQTPTTGPTKQALEVSMLEGEWNLYETTVEAFVYDIVVNILPELLVSWVGHGPMCEDWMLETLVHALCFRGVAAEVRLTCPRRTLRVFFISAEVKSSCRVLILNAFPGVWEENNRTAVAIPEYVNIWPQSPLASVLLDLRW